MGKSSAKKISESIIQKYLNDVSEFINNVIEEPENAESVHVTRVVIRELRSYISFIHPLLEEKNYQDLQNLLRKMTLRFSYHRELDVLIGKWEEVVTLNPELQSADTVLMDILCSEREEEHRNVALYIESKEAFNELETVMELMNGDIWKEESNEEFDLFCKKRLKKWSKLMNELIENLSFDNIQEIHRVRILNKKIRYVQRDIKPYIKKAKKKSIISQDDLEKLQNYLGEICDAGFHMPLLKKISEKYPDPAVRFKCGILSGYEISKAGESRIKAKKIVRKW